MNKAGVEIYIGTMFLIAVIVFVFCLADFHIECVDSGGKTVRGLFWLECINRS